MIKHSHILMASLVLAVLTLSSVSMSRPHVHFEATNDLLLIAHAGGGLPQGRYSNSIEAFDSSDKFGFSLIEADLSWTSNGELVLLHDWNRRHDQYFRNFAFLPRFLTRFIPQMPLSKSGFLSVKMNHGLHQMDLDRLLGWMRDHPHIRIVTDLKSDNIKALALIKNKAGAMMHRFIPQIYAPSQYAKVRALGFETIIFTAYRSPLDDVALVKFLSKNKLFALTIPASRVTAQLVTAAKAHNTSVFTHTLNTKKQAAQMASLGVEGLYTDYLVPAK